jgi:hypothetical protein
MQPIGSRALREAYLARLNDFGHDARVTVQVLNMEERVLASADLVDGQVNIQGPDSQVRRTASLTLSDPDHRLGLDEDSPWQQTMSASRMVRVRHSLEVPGHGTVTVTPFVGPVVSVQRSGTTVAVEAQDKMSLITRGTMPLKLGKGYNAVNALRRILKVRYGESRFRLPTGTRTRLPWAINVGWADDASGFVACQRIARLLGMQFLYSCDGYATLRHRPSSPVVTFDEDWLTALPEGSHDFLGIINYARVTVKTAVRVAQIPGSNRLSPAKLGRNGVPRYLPYIEDLSAPARPGPKATKPQVTKYNAQIISLLRTAENRAKGAISTTDVNLSWTCVPVFHLDVDDPVQLRTPDGTITLPFREGSIPLGVGGDMTGGRKSVVSRPKPKMRRRGLAKGFATYTPPKKKAKKK